MEIKDEGDKAKQRNRGLGHFKHWGKEDIEIYLQLRPENKHLLFVLRVLL